MRNHAGSDAFIRAAMESVLGTTLTVPIGPPTLSFRAARSRAESAVRACRGICFYRERNATLAPKTFGSGHGLSHAQYGASTVRLKPCPDTNPMPQLSRLVPILVLLLPSLWSPSWAQSTSGSVCVAPNSEEPPTRVSPGQMFNPATLLIRIDKRKALAWQHNGSLKIDGLALNERHLLAVISDGKPIQSLWFRFTQYKSSELCASFDGNRGVQLDEKNRSPWCKCD